MRSKSLVLSWLWTAIFAAGFAKAQSWDVYVVGGAGSHNSKLVSQPAIGGDVVFGKGIGLEGELGAVAGHESFGYLSINGSYHFAHGASQKLDPFVTGGYTRPFDPLLGTLGLAGSANAVDFGVGLHYWFLRHLGLRAEFRDIAFTGSGPVPNFWAFRAGIAFR